MTWLQRVTWAVCVLSFVGTAVLLDYTLSPKPEQVTPRELYAVVQKHLAACQAADFPQAYHTSASKVQEHYTLVQFEQKMRQDYRPVAAWHHIEYGAVHQTRTDTKKVLVDVYFISQRGEAIGWTYSLVYEEGDWKVDHGEAIPGWPSGQRLKGLRI